MKLENMKIKVAIIDDHPMVISGLSNMLSPFPQLEVISSFLSGNDFLEHQPSPMPDVVLLDIMMPGIQGPELAKMIKKRFPEMQLLAVSSINTPGQIRQMMKNGCSGFLLKNTDQHVLVEAIEAVYNGEEYIEEKVKELFLQNFLNFREKLGPQHDLALTLTRREKEILKLIIQEHTNQHIAEKLFLSLRTVETHRYNLQQKLKVNNLIGLIKVAIQMGLD